jgi:hypothetical protein
VAQAAAAILSIAVAFGWGTVGAAITASTPVDQRSRLFADSIVTRAYLLLFTLPLVVLLTLVVFPEDILLGSVSTLAYLLPALGGSWFYVGQARPMRLFLLDVLPQGLGVLVGLALTMLLATPWAFIGPVCAFNLLTVVLGWLVVVRRDGGGRQQLDLDLRRALRRLRGQRHGVIAAAAGSINSNGPLLAVAILAPEVKAVYALIDKIFRFAVAGFGPVLQFVQGWIPEAGPAHRNARIRKVAILVLPLGLIGGLCLAALAPVASMLLGGGEITVGPAYSIPYGFVYGGVLVAQVVGLACLIPIGKGRELAISSSAGAVVAVVLMFTLGPLFGAPAIAWAAAAAEVVVAGYQLAVVRAHFRSGRPGTDPHSTSTRRNQS